MNNNYLPNPHLLPLGEALIDSELGETLLRFPGPCGFQEEAQQQMTTLAPPLAKWLFLFRNRYESVHEGIRNFGVFAIFQPERFGIIKFNDHASMQELGFDPKLAGKLFIGANQPVQKGDYYWMPPEQFLAREEWTGFPDHSAMVADFGTHYQSRLGELKQNVLSYMEEVAWLEKLNPQRRSAPWFLTPPEERQKILGDLKIQSRWSFARL